MRKILEKCPSCGGELEVTRLTCTQCDTVILGHYTPCRFCRLSPDSTRLLESFVVSRGNVKEMERDLGISYWTIRRKLEELVKELGLEDASGRQADLTAQRIDILDRLDRGEIDTALAVELLDRLNRAGSIS